MKFTVCTAGWNEAETILPFIRYYLDVQKFDKFIYYDNFSDDKTVELIESVYGLDERVVVRNTPYIGHDPVKEVHLMNETMHEDDCDAFMWVDSDEIIYSPDLKAYVENNFKEKGKNYISVYMTNVYNEKDEFDSTKFNIVDNFDVFFTDPVLKCPLIVKTGLDSYNFCGGHHTVQINGVEYGWTKQESSSIVDDAHLFHFTYINYDMYQRRKTQGRERNLKLGIHNDWYDTYWKLEKKQIHELIESQKTHGVPRKLFLGE